MSTDNQLGDGLNELTMTGSTWPLSMRRSRANGAVIETWRVKNCGFETALNQPNLEESMTLLL